MEVCMYRKVKREYIRIAELPLIVEISEKARKIVRDVLDDIELSSVIMLTGSVSYELVGSKIEERIADILLNKFCVEKSGMEEVRKVEVSTGYSDVDCVVGVGGGKVLDVAKVLASEINAAFISVPTVASHDGIASPIASFKENGRPVSISTKPPTAILADLVVLKHSPIRLLRSGYGDLVSNITAIKDWKLAKEKVGEDFNEVAASMAVMPAGLMLSSAEKLDLKEIGHLEMLVRGLILSGVAISIVGNSRPASGAEHKFSHAVDYLGHGSGTHGEQVAIGTIIMEYLHEKYYGVGNWELIKLSLEKIQAPTMAKEIGLTKDQVLEALMYAKGIRRRRYTILEDVDPTKEEFEVVLNKTGVV
jgi:glycerol-1-phosphate dehydrogenase [NAD(P)+]